MKHDVILFVPVRVKFIDIEADSHIGAIEAAEKSFIVDLVIPTRHGPFIAPGDVEPRTIQYVEPDEEGIRALVDEEGDDDYERSQYYVSEQTGEWVPEPTRARPCRPDSDPYAQWRTDCPACGHAGLIVESVTLSATGERHVPQSILQAYGFEVNCDDDLKDQSTEDEVVRCLGCRRCFDLQTLAL